MVPWARFKDDEMRWGCCCCSRRASLLSRCIAFHLFRVTPVHWGMSFLAVVVFRTSEFLCFAERGPSFTAAPFGSKNALFTLKFGTFPAKCTFWCVSWIERGNPATKLRVALSGKGCLTRLGSKPSPKTCTLFFRRSSDNFAQMRALLSGTKRAKTGVMGRKG